MLIGFMFNKKEYTFLREESEFSGLVLRDRILTSIALYQVASQGYVVTLSPDGIRFYPLRQAIDNVLEAGKEGKPCKGLEIDIEATKLEEKQWEQVSGLALMPFLQEVVALHIALEANRDCAIYAVKKDDRPLIYSHRPDGAWRFVPVTLPTETNSRAQKKKKKKGKKL